MKSHVRKKNEGAELVVRDYGVGITEDAQRRIFEGFFTTQDTMAYSSKRPFDFNAGGKGADLLRMKIFSERYNFKMDMVSARCRFLAKDTDVCPGRISTMPLLLQDRELPRLRRDHLHDLFPARHIHGAKNRRSKEEVSSRQ